MKQAIKKLNPPLDPLDATIIMLLIIAFVSLATGCVLIGVLSLEMTGVIPLPKP